MKKQPNTQKLKPEQIEVTDWGVYPGHIDIDFYICDGMEIIDVEGAEWIIERVTPYQTGVGLCHAARVLEACGVLEIAEMYETQDGEQRIVTIEGYDLDEEKKRDSNLFDLMDDIFYYNMKSFIVELWNMPHDRDTYIREVESKKLEAA